MNKAKKVVKYFETSTGKRIPIIPVNPFLVDSFIGSRPEIEAPTYQIETVAGNVEVHKHTKDTIQTEEEKTEWEEYIQRFNETMSETARLFYEMILTEGTELNTPEKDSDWWKKQERFGIKLPDDPVSLKIHFITTEYLSSREELADLSFEICSLNMSAEGAELLRKSFRSALQGNFNRRIQNAKKPLADKKRSVSRS